MGTDIHGFVEVRDEYLDFTSPDDECEDLKWHRAIPLGHLYDDRSYLAFHCLFGDAVATFEPLAGGRGLPDDVSRAVAKDFALWGGDAHSASWMSWAEITATKWDEPAATRVHPSALEYRRGPGGQWVWQGLNTSSKRLAKIAGVDRVIADRAGEHWPEGTEWLDGDRLFRIDRLTRRQAVPDEEWGDVWAVMGAFAKRHGADNVRLVVWFYGSSLSAP